MAKMGMFALFSFLAMAAYAQEQAPPPDLLELPSINPVVPMPDTGLVPATPPVPSSTPSPIPTGRQPTPEQLKAAEEDRNWAVNALKAKQEEAAARAAESPSPAAPLPGFDNQDALTRALDPLADLREGATPNPTTPGQLAPFQPVLPPPETPSTTEAGAPQVHQAPLINPLTSTPSGPVRPLVGPPPTPEMTLPTQGRSQPPGPNAVKLSSDPNFMPEGYVDPLTRLEQERAAAQQWTAQNLANTQPEVRRPTYRDLRQRIPDPTDRPPF
ncbi:MAG: hypothetical protein OHK005_13920 [Candidatus Methylacidiphilales bacterium]